MSKEQWKVSGFVFETKAEYEKAAKENETVEYIKANSNLKDGKSALKIYMNLLEKDIFETVVGYTFMDMLRKHILASKIVPEHLVPAVVVKKKEGAAVNKQNVSEEKYKIELERLAHKRSISVYLNVFLVITVIAMFVISYYSPKNNLEVATKKVQDQYSQWETELNEREAALEIKENDASNNGQ